MGLRAGRKTVRWASEPVERKQGGCDDGLRGPSYTTGPIGVQVAIKSALSTPETTSQGVPESGPKRSLFAPLVQFSAGPIRRPLPPGVPCPMIRSPSIVPPSVLARARTADTARYGTNVVFHILYGLSPEMSSPGCHGRLVRVQERTSCGLGEGYRVGRAKRAPPPTIRLLSVHQTEVQVDDPQGRIPVPLLCCDAP